MGPRRPATPVRVAREKIEHCAAQAENWPLFADLAVRAFANPGRMQRIGEATLDRLKRSQSHAFYRNQECMKYFASGAYCP
ncbi:hypothetical protein BH11PSE12_BH11PSE12_28090 [soil metagenome]